MTLPTYDEMADSPKEDRGRFEFSATRRLVCAWSDRLSLANGLISWPGQLYPYWEGSGARVDGIGIEPLPGGKVSQNGDGLATYEKAVVTARYTAAGRDSPRGSGRPGLSRNRIRFRESIEPIIDMVLMDEEPFAWSAPGAQTQEPVLPNEAPSLLSVGWEYTFEVMNATAFPAIAPDITGHVNSSLIFPKLLAGRIGFDAETLLYRGPFVTRSTEVGGIDNAGALVRSDGDVLQIAHKFTYKPQGWNRFFRSATPQGLGNFVSMYLRDSDEYKPYPVANFLELTFG
jgi:hypothetical protein